MSDDARPVLEYVSFTTRTNRRAVWVVALAGVVSGLTVGVTGYVVLLCGPILSFLVGAICTHVAVKNRILFGIAGNVVATITCVCMAAVYNWKTGYPVGLFLRQLPGLTLMVLALNCVPGLLGSWVVTAGGGEAEPGERESAS